MVMNNLDTLRAFAVISVVLQHFCYIYNYNIPFFTMNGGWFGLQLFFVLSGYLIIQSAIKYSAKIYFIHRCFRIFPAYLVIFLLVCWLAGVLSINKISREPMEFLINLLLLQHISPNALVHYDILHVTWTLTVELFWYIFALLFLWPLRRFPEVMLSGSIALSIIWRYSADLHYLDNLLTPNDIIPEASQRYFFLNNAFPAQLCFFVMGSYVYIRREILLKCHVSVYFCLIVLFLAPQLFKFTTSPDFHSGLGQVGMLLIALKIPIWKSKVIGWLSTISYSLYLLHFIVFLVFKDILLWDSVIGSLCALVVAVCLASISFYVIERPAMKLARSMTR
jgi:peptidoglycan/LPS O-acetylase OafA/YrhL